MTDVINTRKAAGNIVAGNPLNYGDLWQGSLNNRNTDERGTQNLPHADGKDLCKVQ